MDPFTPQQEKEVMPQTLTEPVGKCVWKYQGFSVCGEYTHHSIVHSQKKDTASINHCHISEGKKNVS